ncbi:MAG: oligoendopeptidase F, partial [Nitratireductor sp.]|nr:oligoendopeptidase F [Nitratireductor sp.]
MDFENRIGLPKALAGVAEIGSEPDLGVLPEWNLADLYPSTGSAEFADDMARSHRDAVQFEENHKGKLADLLAGNPDGLGAAIAGYEEIEARMGRIMSYAGLLYAGNTTDPALAKFYGDAQEQITNAGSHLLFFGLELNRLDADAIAEGMEKSAALRHYKPWLDDLRMDKPYQLEDRIELLFHEKSVTGHAAWNRLFDETMAGLRFVIGGRELTVEPALNLLQDRNREVREEAAREIGRVLHANERIFTLITNTLAKDKEIADRWRGFEDIADSRHL